MFQIAAHKSVQELALSIGNGKRVKLCCYCTARWYSNVAQQLKPKDQRHQTNKLRLKLDKTSRLEVYSYNDTTHASYVTRARMKSHRIV